jgi:DNA polymerase-4
MSNTFLHLDLDTFYVSVERLKNPKLIGQPVIIGGKTSRGVVASCSYEARTFGVHSAMPIALAHRLCPKGIYISGDMEAYSKYSGIVTQIISNDAPTFEKASIDEFYLDLTGMDRFFGSEKWAWSLGDKIKKETGLPLSMGLSVNKTACKIATNEAKPMGKLHILENEVKPFFRPLPIRKLPMVGEVTSTQFKDLGIETIGQLMDWPVEPIQRILGKNGFTLWRKANGIDPTPVIPFRESKGMSKETTLQKDTADIPFLKSILVSLTEQLSFEMRSSDRMTGCVSVRIRYSDFDTHTKQKRIPFTSRDDTILDTVYDLFQKIYERRLLVRLVGVSFSNLINANYQMQLFDNMAKNVHLMMAMDKIRIKYGPDAVCRAIGAFSTPKTK